MNILELAFSNAWGGLEMLVGTFSERFSNKGHDITAVIEPNERLEEIFIKNNITYFKIKPKLKYADIFTAGKVVSFLKDRKIDIIHVHISKDLSTAVWIKKKLKQGKLVFTQHMDSRFNKKDLFHRWVYKNIDHVVSITNSMRENHLAHTPVSGDKISVIHNGIDLSRFSKDTSFNKQEFFRENGIPEDKIIIGTIGRLDRLKRQSLLVESAEKLVKDFSNTHFIFVGEETDSVTGRGYRQELQKMISDKGLEEYFSIFQFTPEIEKFFSILDIFVLTTPKESFGLVLLEAMSMGIPVLGTNLGGPPEIIQDGKNGFIFNPDDHVDLTEKLSIILSDNDLRNDFGYNSIEIVKKNFELGKKIDNYLEIFERML